MSVTTLVTGVDGFTGRYLAPVLAARGHRVHGLVRGEPVGVLHGVEVVHRCDLADQASLASIVSGIQPDFVVHLAAIAFVGHDDIFEIYKTNVLGTRALLESCVGLSRRPEAILVASSANVYGNATEGVLSENARISPANDYAVSKAAGEHLAAIYSTHLPIIVTRPFNYTGVGQSESFLIPKIVAHIRRQAPVIELGNLDVARDFSDVRSVVQVYANLLDAPAAIGKTFNVCSGRAITLGEVLTIAADIAGYKMAVEVNPAFVRANDVKSLCGNKDLLEAVLGPVNIPEIEQTLRWMIQA